MMGHMTNDEGVAVKRTQRYVIQVEGCDDSTYIPADLTPEEFEFVHKLASALNAARSTTCKPGIAINPGWITYDDAKIQYDEAVQDAKDES